MQNQLFRRRSNEPISWLGVEKVKPNTIKAHTQQSKQMYYDKK